MAVFGSRSNEKDIATLVPQLLMDALRDDPTPCLLHEPPARTSTMEVILDELSSPVDTNPVLKDDTKAMNRTLHEHSLTKHVSFGTVMIQEHQLVLGDNPYSDGYPISIDWKHTDPKTVCVDDFEKHHRDLEKMDRSERQLRLEQMGYRKTDIRMQERKRKIRLTEEWAFGDNKDDQPIFGLNTTKKLMQRYVTR